jgi:monovalent cation:H+ antiporter-2, CPA2 family
VLLGLFFITIGMMLDWRMVIERWPLVLLLLVLSITFKLGLITALARLFGSSAGTSLRVGLYLAQAGEFGLVLLTLANQNRLVPPELFNPVLASMVISMMLAPFAIMASNAIVNRLVGSDWLMQSVAHDPDRQPGHRHRQARDHLRLRPLRPEPGPPAGGRGHPYMALDLDPDRVRQAAAAGHSVVFGDAARLQALMAAGLSRASAVVVTYLDTPSGTEGPAAVHDHAPQRAGGGAHRRRPRPGKTAQRRRHRGGARGHRGQPDAGQPRAGAGGGADARVLRMVQTQREARYSLLRGYFHGADDCTPLRTVTVPRRRTLHRPDRWTSWRCKRMGVSVVSIRRAGGGAALPAGRARAGGWRYAGAFGPARTAGAGRREAAARLRSRGYGRLAFKLPLECR